MMKRLLYVGLMAVFSFFVVGCSGPTTSEPETEAETEEDLGDQEGMMDEEMGQPKGEAKPPE